MYRLLTPLCLLAVLASCKRDKDEDSTPIANNKAVTWIKTFGGSNYDFGKSVIQLSNGDYVMAGTTRSTDGDVSGSRVGYDPWLARVDSSGNKVWSTAFGTNADEHTSSLAATGDGGFLIGGHVGFNFDTTSNQAWLIKTNSSGVQTWRKDYTTVNDSKITDVLMASDGSYLAAGYTTTSSGRDGWIMKLDASGNTVWSKTYGGAAEDVISSLIAGADGGYVAAGYSASNDGNVSGNHGSIDAWIFKIDESGNIGWSKTFGGSGKDYLKSIVKTAEGGYAAVGNTNSTNGDISLNRGNFDELVVRIDAGGNKQWVKTFGGSNDEYVTAVVAAPGGGFLSIGYTNSTNFDVNRGSGDFGGWLIKMDNSGNKTASSTYGDSYDELVDDVITTKDGGYIIAGQTYNPSRTYDGWLVKIGPL